MSNSQILKKMPDMLSPKPKQFPTAPLTESCCQCSATLRPLDGEHSRAFNDTHSLQQHVRPDRHHWVNRTLPSCRPVYLEPITDPSSFANRDRHPFG